MLHKETFVLESCSFISNWFDMREQAPGANLLHESVSEASSLVCTEICLPRHDVSPVGQSNSSTTHCEPQSGCFIIQLPRRVLRVYWFGYFPGSVFRERVSGASSLVCTGLNAKLRCSVEVCHMYINSQSLAYLLLLLDMN